MLFKQGMARGCSLAEAALHICRLQFGFKETCARKEWQEGEREDVKF